MKLFKPISYVDQTIFIRTINYWNQLSLNCNSSGGFKGGAIWKYSPSLQETSGYKKKWIYCPLANYLLNKNT